MFSSKKEQGEPISLNDEGGEYDDYGNPASTSADPGEIMHPQTATAMATLTLIRIQPQPDPTNIANCQDSVNALTADANNQQDMVSVQDQVVTIVKQNPSLYHWCFYQSVAQLDQELAKSGLLMNDRANIFFRDMKSLWVFSHALDKVTTSKQYFHYLRSRYIELSQSEFGRNLNVVAPPLSDKRLFFQPGGKPASFSPAD